MKTLRSLCSLILLWTVAVPCRASLAENPEVASGIRLLEVWIESQMAYRGQPGLSIGIVHDQELVWAKGFGYADVQRRIPATTSTIYRMASNTKMFTAMAILQLRDAGKLRLDDPVARHLPWFRLRKTAGEAPITIRHLLTHTSGLPREAAAPYWTDFRFPAIDEIRAKLPTQDAVYPPETKWKYSNLALSLAGEIVSAVSREPYESYVERHLLQPLGMSSSSIVLPDEHRNRLAVGYGRRLPDGEREVMPFIDCRGISPAANLSSTVEDFARFASFLFRGGEAGGRLVLKTSTLREMLRVHWIEGDWKRGWGLGFHLWREGDRILTGHGGSLAGFRTQTAVDLKDKIAVLVMTNANDGNPMMYVQQAFRYVAPVIAKATAPRAQPAQPNPEWDRYTGLYRSSWGDSQVLVYNGELVLIDPTQPDPKESMAKLAPVEEGVFRLEGEDDYSAHGELVKFELDASGAVIRMRVGENYSVRLD